MAKIYEEIVIIKVSKLVADKDANPKVIINDDLVDNLTEVVQQLVGDNVIVETEKAE